MSEFRRRLMMQSKADNPILKDYLTIVSLEDGLTAKLSTNACEYCVDGDGAWKTLPANTDTEPINAGQTLSFRGNLAPVLNSGIGTFTISKYHNLKGNCMSMLFADEGKHNFSLVGKSHAFYKLFIGNHKVISASELNLPAMTIDRFSYSHMFYGCLNLINAPPFPAVILAEYCYNATFSGCKSLTDLSSLELPATSLPNFVYVDMFKDCVALTKAPQLPATELSSACYQQMFYGCTNLSVAPELPALKLVLACYRNMFNGCIKLNYIKMLATDISGSSSLDNWVNGVATAGTFVKANGVEIPFGGSGIPQGWNVIEV